MEFGVRYLGLATGWNTSGCMVWILKSNSTYFSARNVLKTLGDHFLPTSSPKLSSAHYNALPLLAKETIPAGNTHRQLYQRCYDIDNLLSLNNHTLHIGSTSRIRLVLAYPMQTKQVRTPRSDLDRCFVYAL